MPNELQIPSSRVPLIDENTKLTSREWFRFFSDVYQNSPTPTEATLYDVASRLYLFRNEGGF